MRMNDRVRDNTSEEGITIPEMITISKDELKELQDRIKQLNIQVAENNRADDVFKILAERLILATRVASMGVLNIDDDAI